MPTPSNLSHLACIGVVVGSLCSGGCSDSTPPDPAAAPGAVQQTPAIPWTAPLDEAQLKQVRAALVNGTFDERVAAMQRLQVETGQLIPMFRHLFRVGCDDATSEEMYFMVASPRLIALIQSNCMDGRAAVNYLNPGSPDHNLALVKLFCDAAVEETDTAFSARLRASLQAETVPRDFRTLMMCFLDKFEASIASESRNPG